MPHNLERRGNYWHAILMVPADLRPRLGKFKFSQSLGTADKREAEMLKLPLLATWRAMMRRERGHGDSLRNEATKLRALLAELEARGEDDEPLRDHIVERAEAIEPRQGFTTAKQFADIAQGIATPSDEHFAAWQAQLGDLAPKTKDQMQKDVRLLLKRFATLQEINAQSVARWLDEMRAQGASDSSRARIASFCRSYWRHLQTPAVNAVPRDLQPFTGLGIKKKRKGTNGGNGWAPFEPQDVVKLWQAARDGEDAQLADLIMLGAHTGARIEELCSLKLEHLTAHHSFKIVDAKTGAGVREVPIHSAIRVIVARLKRTSEDGYLLSGLTFNKYHDRSNAIGKRFGRLKAAHGFGEQQVFHSLRKSFVTLLENASINENIVADIVGHEKPRITFGLYSGGATLKVKAEAIERVSYPLGRAKLA